MAKYTSTKRFIGFPYNTKLKNLGVVLTMANKREHIFKDTKEALENEFDAYVFDTHIRVNKNFKTLGMDNKTIFDIEDEKGRGFQDYHNLTKEFIQKVEGVTNV